MEYKFYQTYRLRLLFVAIYILDVFVVPSRHI